MVIPLTAQCSHKYLLIFPRAHAVADIVALITKCDGLNTLRLSGNSFGVGACEAIGEALSKIPTVKRLLWSDMFVSRLTDEIPRSLVNNSVTQARCVTCGVV